MRDLEIVQIYGTPRQRGRCHGETMRTRVRETCARWQAHLARAYGCDPHIFIESLLQSTNFAAAIGRYAPDLLEEVNGIAEGADVPQKAILALQLMDEEWWFGRRYGGSLGSRHDGNACSAFASAGQDDFPVMAGQNMDLASWIDDLQILLQISPNGSSPEAYVFSYAGFIGLTGVNRAGLAVCVNTLSQLPYSVTGLPVAFIVRTLLVKNSVVEATDFLQTIQHASGQNYIIADPAGIACFECSAEAAIRYLPETGDRLLCHTNHALVHGSSAVAVNDRQAGHSAANTPPPLLNSEARLAALERRLSDPERPVTVAHAKAALRSHDDERFPVCRPVGRAGADGPTGCTVGSMIYVLSERPALHVTAGEPCRSDYLELQFDDLD